jgi:hypothetical protein
MWLDQAFLGERQHHSSVDPQLIVSQGRLAERGLFAICAYSDRKTGAHFCGKRAYQAPNAALAAFGAIRSKNR